MHRTVAVVAALCVLSSVAVATNTPGATVSIRDTHSGAIDAPNPVLATPPENTTAYLAIAPENVSNATTTDATLDVGGALAVDAAATDTSTDALTLDERLSRANTTTAKQTVIRQTGTELEQRIAVLEAEHRAAIEAYSDEERTTREFVYALARTQTRAEGLRESVDRLETAATSVPGTAIGGNSIDSWARDRRIQLGIVTSPLRERIAGAFRGTGPITVFVEVSDTGVMVTAIDRGQYLRDTYLPSARNDGPPDGPGSTSAALDQVRERYPWAWNHTTGVESGGGPEAGSYRITVFHGHGGLTTYLDPRTGSIFREIQVKRLGEVPTAAPINATDNGLALSIRRTHATGPMNVSVVDSRTAEPVNATVRIDNRTGGRTGTEGYRWTVTPRGAVNVTVVDGDRVVTARFAANPRSPETTEAAPFSPQTALNDGSPSPAKRSIAANGTGITADAAAGSGTTVIEERGDAGARS